MSLASHLLKHLVLTELGGVPWDLSLVTRDSNGKPGFSPSNGLGRPVEFNVSHQAGLVPLIACASRDVEVGIDVVCVNERSDNRTIQEEGFSAWIDLHADVFAPSEVHYMKFDSENLSLPIDIDAQRYGRYAISNCQRRDVKVLWTNDAGDVQELDANVIIDAKLRRFYAFWCLREAYIKMTGEALLAPWLRKLEFRQFKVPKANIHSPLDDSDLHVGEITTEFDIYFNGNRVENVNMELRALGCNYMVASAIRSKDGKAAMRSFPGFSTLSVEEILNRTRTFN